MCFLLPFVMRLLPIRQQERSKGPPGALSRPLRGLRRRSAPVERAMC